MLDAARVDRLRAGEQALARLELAGEMVPSLEWLIYAFVRKEAVLSSQIEGTQCTLEEVLKYELDPAGVAQPAEIAEVVNYVGAMNHGLARLADDFPLSLG